MTTVPIEEVTGAVEAERTVELYVRSLAPGPASEKRERAIERLERLEARGVVDEYTVHIWGERFDPTSAAARTEPGRFVRRRVAAFASWADRNGVSTGSFFEPEPVRSSITGEEYTAVTLPSVALAEFVDGEVAFVAPCSDDGTTCSVEDRLDALELERRAAPAETAPEGRTTEPT